MLIKGLMMTKLSSATTWISFRKYKPCCYMLFLGNINFYICSLEFLDLLPSHRGYAPFEILAGVVLYKTHHPLLLI